MGKDHIGYDELVDNALRGAMREVLLRVAEDGLLGSHHLYITFRTSFPGVDIPSYLRERYPDELTIVLQHQFWGLDVTDEGFSVTLSFNKAREHVSVPFAALTRFADPGVKFGLQFEIKSAGGPGKLELVAGGDETAAEDDSDAIAEDGPADLEIAGNEQAEPDAPVAEEDDSGTDAGEDEAGDGDAEPDTEDDEGDADKIGAEVVTLDSFRKK